MGARQLAQSKYRGALAARRRPALSLEPLETRLLLSSQPPNIILINTDDQRSDTLDVMSYTMDHLVEEGTTFTNSFVTTALCCPSRASLLKGQYAHNTGVWFTSPPTGGYANFDESETVATILHDAGYRTGLVGKYINGYSRAVNNSDDQTNAPVPVGWDDWQALIGNDYYNYTMSENGPVRSFGQRPEDYQTDVLAAKVNDFISSSEANDEQPFFLYFAPLAPHRKSPTTPAPRHIGALDGIAPYRPPSFDEPDISDKTSWIKDLPPLTERHIDHIDQERQLQLETLLAVDDAIAGMMQALEASDEHDNTVIIFTSDNGIHLGEHRFSGKLTSYEESIRVPLVVYDGRNIGQRQSDKLALNIDLTPTVLDLAGLPVPENMDGESLVPLIRGENVSWRNEFLVQNWVPDKFDTNGDGIVDDLAQTSQLGLRTTEWMYIEDLDTGAFELYDMLNDPYQLTNIYGTPGLEQISSSLATRMAELMPTDQAGPIVSGATIEGGEFGTSPLRLRATVSDETTGMRDVRSPEIFVNSIGRFGEGIPLVPVDGKFDSSTEEVELVWTKETYAHFSHGPHTLYLHGRDVALNWGPFVTLNVDTSVRYDDDNNLIVLGTSDETSGDNIQITPIQNQIHVVVNDADLGSHSLPNGIVVYGHDGDDTITLQGEIPGELHGGNGNDQIAGGAGDDIIRGGRGDDLLYGNAGDDLLHASFGNDRLFGGLGQDDVRGHKGDDRLDGGDGADVLRAGIGNDRLSGGRGADRLLGSDGYDTVFETGDVDWLLKTNQLVGWEVDTLSLIEHAIIAGGVSNNHIDASQFSGPVILKGHEGDDILLGGVFNDVLYGGDGHDTIYGRSGDELIYAQEGDDIVYGMMGDDIIVGKSGDDRLFGGFGDDRLFGGPGIDRLFGDQGHDRIIGDEGNDILHGNDDADRINGGAGDDVIYGHDGDDLVFGMAGNDVIYGKAGADRLYGGFGADQLFGGDDVDMLYGQDGDDVIQGENGNDRLIGNDGNDRLVGHSGNDELYGSGGDDVLYGSTGDDQLFGGNGIDYLIGGDGNDAINGGFDSDLLIGGLGQDALHGDSGPDILVGGIATFDQNAETLADIMTIFAGPLPIDERIALIIEGSLANPPVIDRSTSFRDDYRQDMLIAGSDDDWFIAMEDDLLEDLMPEDRVTIPIADG